MMRLNYHGRMPPLLEVRDLSITFASPQGDATAVRGVDFTLAPGETLGIVGESGSGKSATALAMMRLLPPQARVTGSIRFNGVELLTLDDEKMRAHRGAQLAMIFQEPMTSLNPVMRIGEQVAEAVTAHGGQHKDAMQRAIESLRECGIPEPEQRARDYPHQFSGGMRQRAMIAMALVNRPTLLIADEPTTALDVTIQAQVLDLLRELKKKHNLAMLFISHDLGVVAQVADRVAVMYAGQIVEEGPVGEVFAHAMHPYTRGLLAAMPSLKTERSRELAAIEGSVPPPDDLPPGCGFEPRCGLRQPACQEAVPPLVTIGAEAAGHAGHRSRCPVTVVMTPRP